ncbi:hypothetical protein BN1723_016840, partial [Verticillium longisporum]
MRNDLVRAYRKFEEQSVAPLTKVDRNEKISLVDVRKVRWILVYAIYQVLRNCTDVPEEVNDIDADYNLAVSEIYRIMCDDFEALYELLVNDNFTSAGSIPLLAQGGICAVQSVHAFDVRYDFKSLDHPLPLLPEVPTTPTSRRIPW